MLRRLLASNVKVCNYVCSDINNDLISLWNEIKNNPDEMSRNYHELWNELNIDNNIERKKQYYCKIRKRFNTYKSPYDFLFITRTAINGMTRYNKNGDFNSSFHLTRNGIAPNTLKGIINEWSKLLNENNVKFECCSYNKICPNAKDFCYLDPPYANTNGMYYGTINYINLWEWIRDIKCHYLLSFDGISGETDNTYEVPKDIYNRHEYIKNGNSSFKRTTGKSKDSIVNESLYIA